jgi:biopolymer transport protein ExbB/TolQ
MTDTPQSPPRPTRATYSWLRDDLEARLGSTSSRFTQVNSVMWLVVAFVLTVATYGTMSLFPNARLVEMFTQRGPVQYVIVLFTYWSLLILLVKWQKTRVQRRTLQLHDLVPASPDFVLSPATVGQILGRLRRECDDVGRFVLFNRIDRALSNMKNMGQIGDVDHVLQSQAASDEDVMESSYSLIRGLIWATPVLGFIGTVQGLSVAIGAFGGAIRGEGDFEQIRPALVDVTGGLATAFETTYVALVATLIIQLLLTVVHKAEEELLDAFKDYTQRHILGRIRLTPFDHVE